VSGGRVATAASNSSFSNMSWSSVRKNAGVDLRVVPYRPGIW
jgi:hypothetical protein